MKPTYISWAPYCSRSDNTARELGGTSHMVYRASLGSSVWTVWLKYLAQAIDTFRILAREQPDVVFVMSPPVFAVLTVWLWCRLRGAPYVVDAHTAAFLHPRWKHWQWLHNALCRRAATTIITNEHLAARLRSAGAHTTTIRDVPVRYAVTDAFRPEGPFSVAVVCSFNYDEPIAEIITAAADLDGIRFYMTGDPQHLDRFDLRSLPPNVTLTGFLSDEAYGSLITNSDAVLTLTTRDHTMLRGAYEAVYQGTPVIISDWPILREAFNHGAVHVDNTAPGIAAGIREMRGNHAHYRSGVLLMREQKHAAWQHAKASLLARVNAVRGAVQPRRAVS
jgi:glycosyltransferase involved in cell wall biosynthesis